MQWLPTCDRSFTEANAKVVCKELGFNSSTFNNWFTWKKHYYNESQMIVAAQSWPQHFRCLGKLIVLVLFKNTNKLSSILLVLST